MRCPLAVATQSVGPDTELIWTGARNPSIHSVIHLVTTTDWLCPPFFAIIPRDLQTIHPMQLPTKFPLLIPLVWRTLITHPSVRPARKRTFVIKRITSHSVVETEFCGDKPVLQGMAISPMSCQSFNSMMTTTTSQKLNSPSCLVGVGPWTRSRIISAHLSVNSLGLGFELWSSSLQLTRIGSVRWFGPLRLGL